MVIKQNGITCGKFSNWQHFSNIEVNITKTPTKFIIAKTRNPLDNIYLRVFLNFNTIGSIE
jgi:hypothetical protein